MADYDGADGLMAYEGFYHPDMLLEIPSRHLTGGQKITRTLAKRQRAGRMLKYDFIDFHIDDSALV